MRNILCLVLKMEHDSQPLERIMAELNLKSADLVRSSAAQLTFKQVRKAMDGRRVTANIQAKICDALNACIGQKRFTPADLFDPA